MKRIISTNELVERDKKQVSKVDGLGKASASASPRPQLLRNLETWVSGLTLV
jgi:hypothetical protein